MSGPYNQQAGFGQGVGHVGQFSGQNAGQYGGQVASQAAGRSAGPAAGQAAGQAVGSTVTQSSSSQRAESHQVQQSANARVEKHQRQEREASQATSIQQSTEGSQRSRQDSGEKSYHHHRNRDRDQSHSSSSSSAGAYNVKGSEGGPYGANGSYGSSGSFGAGAGPNPCGQAPPNPCVEATQVEGPRRQGRHKKEVIRLPDQPVGPTRQVRRRLPTPEPDVLEKIYVQRVAGEVIEEITEIPTTPPPIVQERNVCEPAGPPKVIKRTVRVPPRGGNNCQPSGNFASNAGQSSNLISAGSYGSVQQASGNFQQFEGNSPVTVSGGFGGAPVGALGGGFGGATSSFSSAPSGFGGAPVGAVGGGFGSFSPVGNNFSTASPAFGSQGASFQQQATSFGGGFQQQAASFGGSFQQQAASYAASNPFKTGFSFITQGGVAPSAGLHQATCFYV